MEVDNLEGVKLVEFWLIEHASKHRYSKVLQYISERDGMLTISHPLFPVVWYSTCCLHTIVTNKDWKCLHEAVDLVELLFRNASDLDIRLYAKLSSGLKMMALMNLLKTQKRMGLGLVRLNRYFPRSGINAAGATKEFIDTLLEKQMNFRRFFLSLLASEKKREAYLANDFKCDYDAEFMKKLQKLTNTFLDDIRKKMPLTAVEEILSMHQEADFITAIESQNSIGLELLLDILKDKTELDEDSILSLLTELSPTENMDSSIFFQLDSSDDEDPEGDEKNNEGKDNLSGRKDRKERKRRSRRQKSNEGEEWLSKSKQSNDVRATKDKEHEKQQDTTSDVHGKRGSGNMDKYEKRLRRIRDQGSNNRDSEQVAKKVLPHVIGTVSLLNDKDDCDDDWPHREDVAAKAGINPHTPPCDDCDRSSAVTKLAKVYKMNLSKYRTPQQTSYSQPFCSSDSSVRLGQAANSVASGSTSQKLQSGGSSCSTSQQLPNPSDQSDLQPGQMTGGSHHKSRRSSDSVIMSSNECRSSDGIIISSNEHSVHLADSQSNSHRRSSEGSCDGQQSNHSNAASSSKSASVSLLTTVSHRILSTGKKDTSAVLGAVDGDPSLNQSYNQDLFASGSPDPSAPALVDVLVSPVVADHALTKVKLTESLARCQEYANKVVQYDQVSSTLHSVGNGNRDVHSHYPSPSGSPGKTKRGLTLKKNSPMSLKRQRKNETSSEHESTFCSCKSEADDSDPNILSSPSEYMTPPVTRTLQLSLSKCDDSFVKGGDAWRIKASDFSQNETVNTTSDMGGEAGNCTPHTDGETEYDTGGETENDTPDTRGEMVTDTPDTGGEMGNDTLGTGAESGNDTHVTDTDSVWSENLHSPYLSRRQILATSPLARPSINQGLTKSNTGGLPFFSDFTHRKSVIPCSVDLNKMEELTVYSSDGSALHIYS